MPNINIETLNEAAAEVKKVATPEATKEAAEGKTKVAYFQCRLPEDQRDALKGFFATKGISISDGLAICSQWIMHQIEEGTLTMDKSGIYFKK